jgi:hypothetical protein
MPPESPDLHLGHSDSHPLVTAATKPAYVKYTEDGWPRCPGCGADALWSAEARADIELIVGCLRCEWQPGYGIKVRG